MEDQTPAGWRSRQDYENWFTDVLVCGRGIYKHGDDGLIEYVPVEDGYAPPLTPEGLKPA